MLTVAVINYLIVASIGLFLFVKFFTKRYPKMVVGVVHGSLGLLGLGMIIFYISFQQGDAPVVPFFVLLIAFFFGSGMLIAKATGKSIPKAVVIIHVLIAVSGIYLLISFWRM